MGAAAMTVTLTVGQSGPRNSRTDTDGLRFYSWQGRDLPSVTTIRRLAGLPHNLHQWTLTQVINRAVDDWPGISAQLATGEPTSLEAVRKHLRLAATEERDRKAALGKAVHEAAEANKALTEVGPDIAPFLRQDHDWRQQSRADIVLVERQVWNLTVGYAGTFDRIVRFPDGSLWIVDLKTGKGAYGEHALQLMAYVMAEFVGNDDQVDVEATELLRQVSGIAVLHLRSRSWEFHSLRPDHDTWVAFRGLLAFATWIHDHADIEQVSLGSRKGGQR